MERSEIQWIQGGEDGAEWGRMGQNGAEWIDILL